MDNLERLEDKLQQTGLNIDYHGLPNCRGFYRKYSNGYEYMSVSPDLPRSEKTCVAYHEAGHRYMMLCDGQNSKNEYRANKWAVKNLIPVIKLVDALESGAKNTYEAAEYLQISEAFLKTTLLVYSRTYGLWTIAGKWVVSFYPTLMAFNYITERHLPE